jgi:hypothetical protein
MEGDSSRVSIDRVVHNFLFTLNAFIGSPPLFPSYLYLNTFWFKGSGGVLPYRWVYIGGSLYLSMADGKCKADPKKEFCSNAECPDRGKRGCGNIVTYGHDEHVTAAIYVTPATVFT